MNLEQLIKIAKAGFPERILSTIDFDNCEMFHKSGVYRLYDKDVGFNLTLPSQDYLAVCIGPDKFIQITCGIRAFNHHAAIKEMERLGLIDEGSKKQPSFKAELASIDFQEKTLTFTTDYDGPFRFGTHEIKRIED